MNVKEIIECNKGVKELNFDIKEHLDPFCPTHCNGYCKESFFDTFVSTFGDYFVISSTLYSVEDGEYIKAYFPDCGYPFEELVLYITITANVEDGGAK